MPINFLADRQRLIALVVKLNQTIDARHNEVARVLVGKLCNALVDYLSAGHFQVYGAANIGEADDEYRRIEATTEIAMVFHDRFGASRTFDRDAVKGALETLALALETRFELEDSMLTRPLQPMQVA
ncbi:MAG: Rsd/AlgQ family anti-sigma factor [Gammaproteobacteria bacterium]|nr:Rsd/AlgQ family anti-sigma factor [Gammaproteobacteria bacterium]